MAGQTQADASKALNVMATAATTLREAISSSLPVANNQIMTVQIPGTVINYNDYFWDQTGTAFKPHFVRANEAMLVDGILPLSKITMGKTGKSVARSYLSALDMMVPVEASLSGLIAGPSDGPIDPRSKIIKDRYTGAMDYLTSRDVDTGQSKITRYVEKQDHWAKAVQLYASVQEQQQKIANGQYPNDPDKAREEFMQWLQVHSRDFKAAIQARYMDWVVHGYKFNVEFNFGIVDISSGMARVEASKEACRNLTIVGIDGFSEHHQVNLTPSNWASLVRDKVQNWNVNHGKPTPSEIRAELRRLKTLKVSLEALKQDVSNSLVAVVERSAKADPSSDELRAKFRNAYASKSAAAQGTTPQKEGEGGSGGTISNGVDGEHGGNEGQANGVAAGKPGIDDAAALAAAKKATEIKTAGTAIDELITANKKWNDDGRAAANKAVTNMSEDNKKTLNSHLDTRIAGLETDISYLEAQLTSSSPSTVDVIDGEGDVVSSDEAKLDPELFKAPVTDKEALKRNPPSPWTRIVAKVSSSQSESSKMTEESATSVAAQASWGLWNASGGFSHASSSAKAMSAMSSLDIEVAMDCMLVEIERPWLHAELFVDKDLDIGNDFALSPGEMELKKAFFSDTPVAAEYQQFSSYPTAFVIAADVELSFNGNCSSMSSEMEASSTEANVSVGWGPFAVSASHKQSKTSQKTRTEATATGMKISLQAPQIIGWVQTLVPQLPRPRDNKNNINGIMLRK